MKKIIAKLKNHLTRKNLTFLGLFFGILVALYLLMDLFVMPLYTRQHQSINVPTVTNMSLSAAEKRLRDNGLKVVIAGEKYDENYPPGHVLFQNPEGSSPVKKGRRVYLTVGKGKQVLNMPKLVGLSDRDARFVLADHNLQIGNVFYELDNFYPEEVVSKQSLPAGNTVVMGESIDFTVSLGLEPTEFIVPELIGKTLKESRLHLKKSGLVLGQVTYQTTDKLLPDTIIHQSLKAGETVEKADTVHVVLSQLPETESHNE